MKSYSIAIVLLIFGQVIVNVTEKLPWPIYCQTKSGEFCNIELNQSKLYCPSTCWGNDHKNGSSHLIADLTTLDDNSLEHSRVKRQASPLDVFTATMFLEFTRMFFDAYIR